MRKIILTLLLAMIVLMPGGAYAASTICSGAACTSTEVGPFMAGITKACGNEGTCSIGDIEIVFNNVGNWILGIIGALVFLMYVIGGFYFLLSGLPGMEKWRDKGKTALKQSTVGLVIVFLAFASLQTLNSVLRSGSLPAPNSAYVSCGPGAVNDGGACDLNSTCVNGACVSQCVQQHPPSTASAGGYTIASWSDCANVNDPYAKYGAGVTSIGCTPNLCPGGDEIQCCDYTYVL